MTKNPIAEQRLVLQIPEMRGVSVDRDIPFGRQVSDALRLDVYRPPVARQSPQPAVIFVTGYSDIGAQEAIGCNLKDCAPYIDWARLVASAGIMAITYVNEGPLRDGRALLEHIETNAESLGVDTTRLAIWSCSGNTSTALALLQEHSEFKCAAFCYGYMIDAPGHDEVARASAQFGFVNATAKFEISELNDVPILVARAGRDEMPGLNASLDRMISRALAANLPISVVNHPSGPHAFDLFDPTEDTRQVVRQVLEFLTLRLGA